MMRYAVMIAVLLFVIAVWLVVRDEAGKPRCIRSHSEQVYVPSTTKLMPMGKTVIPVFQPARYEWRNVCDEYEQPATKPTEQG